MKTWLLIRIRATLPLEFVSASNGAGQRTDGWNERLLTRCLACKSVQQTSGSAAQQHR